MAEYYVRSDNGADWAASTAKSSGDRVVPTRAYGTAAAKGYVYECTTAGTTGGSEPTWNTTVGGTTSDGTAVWTTREATSIANASRYLDYIYNNRATAGDTIYVKSTHSEAPSGSYSLTNTGSTASNPIRVVCADFSAQPPTALATGAVVQSGAGLTLNDPIAAYGIEFKTPTGANNLTLLNSVSEARGPFESCILNIGSGGQLNIFGNYSSRDVPLIRLKNTTITFNATGSTAQFYMEGAQLVMEGGAINSGYSGGVLVTGGYGYGYAKATLIGVDLSGLAATSVNSLAASGPIDLFDCKMKASFSFTRPSTPYHIGHRAHNCDDGNTHYRVKESHYAGDVDSETTLVRTGGYTENGQALSHKLVTTANAKLPIPLYGPWMAINNDTTGSAKTVTCEILHDSATNLTDKQIWLEVMGLDQSASCKASLYSDAAAAIWLPSGASADQAASSETWTTTGMTNPNKQKLSVTFTPQKKGPIMARVAMAVASKTVYVCPKLAVA